MSKYQKDSTKACGGVVLIYIRDGIPFIHLVDDNKQMVSAHGCHRRVYTGLFEH